jgi:hypothetical protein
MLIEATLQTAAGPLGHYRSQHSNCLSECETLRCSRAIYIAPLWGNRVGLTFQKRTSCFSVLT